MKINKLLIILGLFILPILLNAQENKTNKQVNNVITEITDSGVTFTVPNIVLDSTEIDVIKKTIEKEIVNQTQKNNKPEASPKKEKTNIIVYDDKYMYVLNTREAYDDDYGPYYYTEWKITQYLKSTGKVVAETDYREGKGKFSTFKELESQKDFRPVKECKLAQLAFQAMHKQENLK